MERILSQHGFTLFFILAALAASLGYYNWYVDPELVGIVEAKFHPIGAREDGKISEVLVDVGSAVTTGQPLARLKMDDLEDERRGLVAEQAKLEGMLEADATRFALEYERLRLQVESDYRYMAEKIGLLQSWRSELASLSREIDRLKNAEAAGLGRSRDLAEMQIRRDALKSLIAEQEQILRDQRRRARSPEAAANAPESGDRERVISSMLTDRMTRLNEIRLLLAINKARMDARVVTAPCNGLVVEMLARTGDAVLAFDPIVNIAEARADFLDIYLPELSGRTVQPGQVVDIYSKRGDGFNTSGVIDFVHPGFSRIPERLMFRGQVYWARKVRVKMNDGHKLLPGESVRVKILDDMTDLPTPVKSVATIGGSEAAEKGATPQAIELSPGLSYRTPVEASGIVWLNDLQRYLVISDDTGSAREGEHRPWVFLMNEQGVIEPEPLVLHGVETVNDLEAVVQISETRLLLLASQSLSKRGKRRDDRQYLLDVKRNGRKLQVTRKIVLLQAILKSHSRESLAGMGLAKANEAGELILDIEGAAYRDGALYLGVKEPSSDDGALILKLDDIDNALETGRVAAGQLSVYGRVKLGCKNSVCAGISDMTFDSENHMLVLSTLPDVPDSEQLGSIQFITREASGVLVAERLQNFPGLKPEGICEREKGRYMVVFDRGDKDSLFIGWEWRP